jgi:hypothetical protein
VVASRWLMRSLEEDPHATIEEVALAASSPAALPEARAERWAGGGMENGVYMLGLPGQLA